jgi:tetratricopeptide (TPR) repeat protein
MMVATDWVSASAMLFAGLAVGGFFVWNVLRSQRARTAAAPPDDTSRDDLIARRDSLVQQLRDLDADAGKLTPEHLAAERKRLELATAAVMRELDRTSTSPKRSGKGAPKEAVTGQPSGGISPTVKGFLWGIGSATAVALLFFFVTQSAKQKGTEPPAAGRQPMAAAPAPSPQDEAELLQARAAVEKNPNDLAARLNLARIYFERDDLPSVIRETQFVLDKFPNEPRAMTYQALVRIATGDTVPAIDMLKKAARTDPSLIDAWVGLAYAYTQQGKSDEAAAAISEAMKRHPEEKERLTELLQAMRAHASAGVNVPPGAVPPGGMPPAAAEQPPMMAGGAMAGGATPAAVNGPKLRLNLDIEAAARARITPTAVLYIIARPAGVSGGPPSAVKRLPPGPFPMSVELSAADSMMGQALPDKLHIEARIDFDGNAMTREPGDPVASQDNVSASAGSVSLKLH